MPHRRWSLALSVLPILCLPNPAAAQIGALVDWINSLSGPGLVRVGPEVVLFEVDDRNDVRFAPLFTVFVDDRGNPDSDAADIGAFSAQAVFESTLVGQGRELELRSRLGFELHRFWGEFDSFWAPSFPALIALHRAGDGWAFRVGTGFNVFSFPDDAFAPHDTGVETDGFDAGWTVQAEVEVGTFSLFR